MKTITIHCDYCTMQLFYENDTLNKKDSFRTIYSVDLTLDTAIGNKKVKGHFCSFDCFSNKVQDLFGSAPIKEDVLKSMADSLGYEIKRKQQINLENRKEE